MGQSTPIIFDPIANEIQRVIERHRASGHILCASDVAADILQTFPGTGVEVEHLANKIMITAAWVGVPVMIGDHGSEDLSNSEARLVPPNHSFPEV